MTRDLAPALRSGLIGALEQQRDDLRDLVNDLTEKQLWAKPMEPGNSAGHLILHLTGNLNHFVGAHLGKTGYIRDREREFTETKPPSKTELLAGLDGAVATFRRVVERLTPEQLEAPHPEERFGTVLNALVRLLAHFALHRGQISYIVRIVKK